MYLVYITGLEKDALHIYTGIGIYLICLAASQPILRKQSTRQLLALLAVTSAAMLGEVLDVGYSYPNIGRAQLGASIHDIINTCFWPYVLYAINRWTTLFKS